VVRERGLPCHAVEPFRGGGALFPAARLPRGQDGHHLPGDLAFHNTELVWMICLHPLPCAATGLYGVYRPVGLARALASLAGPTSGSTVLPAADSLCRQDCPRRALPQLPDPHPLPIRSPTGPAASSRTPPRPPHVVPPIVLLIV